MRKPTDVHLPLRANQTRDEIGVADVILVGGTQLFLVDLQDASEFEIFKLCCAARDAK